MRNLVASVIPCACQVSCKAHGPSCMGKASVVVEDRLTGSVFHFCAICAGDDGLSVLVLKVIADARQKIAERKLTHVGELCLS